jgi:hypothetical protein
MAKKTTTRGKPAAGNKRSTRTTRKATVRLTAKHLDKVAGGVGWQSVRNTFSAVRNFMTGNRTNANAPPANPLGHHPNAYIDPNNPGGVIYHNPVGTPSISSLASTGSAASGASMVTHYPGQLQHPNGSQASLSSQGSQVSAGSDLQHLTGLPWHPDTTAAQDPTLVHPVPPYSPPSPPPPAYSPPPGYSPPPSPTGSTSGNSQGG